MVIQAIPTHIAAEFEIAQPAKRRTEAALKLCFPVPSLAAARIEAERLGGVVDGPEHEWRWEGVTICDGQDPEGNVMQLREEAVAVRRRI